MTIIDNGQDGTGGGGDGGFGGLDGFQPSHWCPTGYGYDSTVGQCLPLGIGGHGADGSDYNNLNFFDPILQYSLEQVCQWQGDGCTYDKSLGICHCPPPITGGGGNGGGGGGGGGGNGDGTDDGTSDSSSSLWLYAAIGAAIFIVVVPLMQN